jgi:hypothetical protein
MHGNTSLYPDLPDIQSIDVSTHERSSLLGNQPQSMSRPVIQQQMLMHHPSSSAPPSIQMVAMANRSNDSEQLVSDLISQNAQLSEELAQLRVQLSLVGLCSFPLKSTRSTNLTIAMVRHTTALPRPEVQH